MEMLVQEAIDFSVANPDAIEAPKSAKEVKVEEVVEEEKKDEEE